MSRRFNKRFASIARRKKCLDWRVVRIIIIGYT